MKFRVALVLAAVSLAAGCGGGGEEAEPERTVALGWVPAAAPGEIVTVAGTGAFGTEGVGGPPAEAELQIPVDLAFDRDGSLFIAERYNHRILEVDPSGTLTVAVGVLGEHGVALGGFSGDGGPAVEAKLNEANAIATGPDGELYISDSRNHRIRMVDGDGVITTVVGNGEQGFSGDGGPATEASLDYPLGLGLDGEGNLYFVDSGNDRIRKVDPDGVITTVLGTGKAGFSPDGTAAGEALLGSVTDHMPVGLEFDAEGNLVYTDMGNRRIRMVDGDGRVRTVAGNGEFGYSGEGGPAVEAAVNDPMDVTVAPDGTLYVATHTHGLEGNLVLAVDADGVITTLAGGETGYEGDGGPASGAKLAIPAGIEIGPDGNLYIADAGNDVIRMVALP